MAKRLKYGKGIKVRSDWGDGEIVRSYTHPMDSTGPSTRSGETSPQVLGTREYEIRLGPAHFVYLQRKDFDLVDSIIKFASLVKLRQTRL